MNEQLPDVPPCVGCDLEAGLHLLASTDVVDHFWAKSETQRTRKINGGHRRTQP